MKAQLTGMRGVYLVAAELSRLGYIASPTSRSAQGADILVTDQACRQAFTVQVKTNSAYENFWLVGKDILVSPTHLYVLVNLVSKGGRGPEYFIVPSREIKERVIVEKSPKAEFYSISRKDIAEFLDKWGQFDDPPGKVG